MVANAAEEVKYIMKTKKEAQKVIDAMACNDSASRVQEIY